MTTPILGPLHRERRPSSCILHVFIKPCRRAFRASFHLLPLPSPSLLNMEIGVKTGVLVHLPQEKRGNTRGALVVTGFVREGVGSMASA